MGIVFLIVIVLFMFTSFVAGLYFLCGAFGKLSSYDPEFDERGKKWRAILDLVLGIALLLFFNGFFWLVLYPLGVLCFNLPTFSW
jgi:hypothetical protein